MSHHPMEGLDLRAVSPLILDAVPVALTLIDLDGRMLYFNAYAAKILDRKPDYLGRDVRQCHRKAESNAAIDRVLKAFREGSREEVRYDIVRKGRAMTVTLGPLYSNGGPVACIQVVTPKA